MQIIVVLRSTMQYIGLTPRDSTFLTLFRIALIVSLMYANATDMWYILFEGQTFGDIAKVASSLDMYLDVLMVYVLYLWVRHAFFRIVDEMGDVMDHRKIDFYSLVC